MRATVLVLVLVAGCPGPRMVPTDGGLDARDVPSTDVPGADGPGPDGPRTDAPASDAPAADAPLDAPGTDAPGTDVPTASCGDGVANGTEDCDGADLGGATCLGRGFDGGTLSCAADCSFDTSGCTRVTCGNGARDGGEACDGADLGGATCASAGFMGGTLTCATDCTLDTSACMRCGDGRRSGSEVCDGADLGGATCPSGTTGTVTCAADCAAVDERGCMADVRPAVGQVVITELMPDPAALGDAMGEWFEVTNVGATTVQLRNCRFVDTAGPGFAIATSLLLAPGEIATFAASGSPGFSPTYVYASSALALNNGTDGLRLECDAVVIDAVSYTAAWPYASGVAAQLDPSTTDASANDVASAWCEATAAYAVDLGTPGAANASCGAAVEDCTNGTDDDGDGLVDCADVGSCGSAPSCGSGGPSLLFSEVVETSSAFGNGKAVEIRNLGTTDVDLAAASCSVRVYANGSMTAMAPIGLTGTLAAGDVFVLCNSMAVSTGCDDATMAFGANGDDAIELRCGGVVLDVFGRIGEDPGTEWGTGPTSTADGTLRRLCSVTAGDTDGADAFSPATEWAGFPDGTLTGLGSPACAP